MIAPYRAALVRPATLSPESWPKAISNLRALGFDAVELSAVWRDHDRGGDMDFSRGRDLGAFAARVAAEGMRVILRLGPGGAEDAPAFGVPDRVLRDPEVCARTRRGNPVVTLDGLRVLPTPSPASARWREASGRWVRAACAAVLDAAPREALVAVSLGPLAVTPFRDAPCDRDHHPDLGAAGDDRSVSRSAPSEYLRVIAREALAAGFRHEELLLAPGPSPLTHPATLDLSSEYAVMVRAPTPRWGVEGLWRVARLATTLPRGAAVEVRVGGGAFAEPVRATHALQCARVVLAAGVRSLSVAAGCVGHRWPGALLDERGAPRAHAKHWARLLEESLAWPPADAARERARVVEVDAERVASWWRAEPLGALPRAVILSGLPHPSLALTAEGDRSYDLERSLQRDGVPWLVAMNEGWCAAPSEAFSVQVDPPGGALLRATEGEDGATLLAVSAGEETARLRFDAPWTDEEGGAVREVEVLEGVVRSLRRRVAP